MGVAQDGAKVLFDETGPYGGKGFTIYNLGVYGSSSFATLLEENGFTVSRLTEDAINSEKLKGYNVLIIMDSGRTYTDEEINSIKEFVNNGGGLFLVGSNWGYDDGDENFAFNKIARSFGVDFTNNEIVVDAEHNIVYPTYVKISNITPSPVTANIQEFYYLMGTYIRNPGNSTVISSTDSDSWGDKGFVTSEGYTSSNYQKDANETGGPLPVISTMEYGKGKIVFMGAAGTFVNSWIYRDNGWKLGLNAVSWLDNRPVPSDYKTAGLISLNLADLWYRILGMILFTLILIAGLIYKIRKDKNTENSKTFKTIKNWKFNGLIILNAVFALLAGILFIPINYYLFDITTPPLYDPNFGYILIITGIIFLLFTGATLYNIVARNRMVKNYSYFNIFIILFFSGFTFLLGDLFSFPSMEIFTLGSLVLLIPSAINLWIFRAYGEDLIVEGKEFDRLKKLPMKTLPYELHASFTNSQYIGEGGFGRVFKATHPDGKEVAIKIPKSFDKKSEKIFISEVSNWIDLDHPNIVKLYDFKILPIPYIEMEFCDESLEHEKKPFEEAIFIIYNIALGLQYAHERNIIHGDIKPSNIMINKGVYKISDWGLSKLTTGESVTLSGATPQYAAPEQISIEFGKADARTDIYQLGTVFYELLTGNLPFKGDISQVYHSVLNTQPALPSKISPDAEPVNDIIMKCLHKNKDERYSSMAELIKDLEEYYKPDASVDRTLLLDDMEKPK